MFSVLFTMTDHSWAANSLVCSQKRFKQLLYETPAKIMLDKNQVGNDYWERIKREKETARKLNEINFTWNLYYDY